jgi:NAD-dependent dihydropyrimidine dehydrogenase PreA subunit
MMNQGDLMNLCFSCLIDGTGEHAPITLEEAAYRARNVAAPMNAQRHKYKTPCAFKMDHCYDCRSPQRICSAQVIYWRKMNHTDMEVVLIDEDMGY